MKKWNAIILIITLLLSSSVIFAFNITMDGVTATYDEKPITLILNGEKFTPNQNQMPPIIIDDRTLVPVREVFEKLDGKVFWDASTRSVTLQFSNNLSEEKKQRVIQLTIDSDEALVDGIQRKLDVPAKIINDKTMVPARFIAEMAYFDVQWHPSSRTVYINKDKISVKNSLEENFYEVDEDGVIEITLNRKLTANEKLVVKVTFNDKCIDYSDRLIENDCKFLLEAQDVIKDFADEILGYESLRVDIYVESLETGELLTGGFNTMTKIKAVNNKKEFDIAINDALVSASLKDEILSKSSCVPNLKGVYEFFVKYNRPLKEAQVEVKNKSGEILKNIEASVAKEYKDDSEKYDIDSIRIRMYPELSETYTVTIKNVIDKEGKRIEDYTYTFNTEDTFTTGINVKDGSELYADEEIVFNLYGKDPGDGTLAYRVLYNDEVLSYTNAAGTKTTYMYEYIKDGYTLSMNDIINFASNIDLNLIGEEITIEVFYEHVMAEKWSDEARKSYTYKIVSDDTIKNLVALFNIDDGIEILENEVWIPARVVGDKLKGGVVWTEKEQKVVLTVKDLKMEFVIGSDITLIDGEEYQLPDVIESRNGKTMLPGAWIAKVLDYGYNINTLDETFEIIDENI